MAAMLIQMAISRSREYLADETGAAFAGNAEGLARALEKLGTYARRMPLQANPSTAHMFIVNPLSGKGLANVFSTHPPLANRIARLRGVRPGGDTSGPGSGAQKNMRREARDFWDKLSR
jgi:heat shock protein HtpX